MHKSSKRKQEFAGWRVAQAIFEMAFQGLGVDKSVVCLMHDVFPWDSSLHEATMRNASTTHWPECVVTSGVWAPLSTRDDQAATDQDAVNQTISEWLQVQILRKIHACAKEKVLSVPEWKELSVPAQSQSCPTYDRADYKVLWPVSEKELLIRDAVLQDVLSHVAENKEACVMVEKARDDHNKKYDPSGRGYHGEKAKPTPAIAAARGQELEPMKNAPADMLAVSDNFGQHILLLRMEQEFYITTQGKCLLHALADATLDPGTSDPICCAWGRFHTGSQADELSRTSTSPICNFRFDSEENKGFFSVMKGSGPAFQTGVRSLKEFLLWLEEHCNIDQGLSLPCHEIVAKTKKNDTGAKVSRNFDVSRVQSSVFQVLPTERKLKAEWTDAGSYLLCANGGKNWDLVNGKHGSGHLLLCNRLVYKNTNQEVGILPEKVAITLSDAYDIKKDQWYELA